MCDVRHETALSVLRNAAAVLCGLLTAVAAVRVPTCRMRFSSAAPAPARRRWGRLVGRWLGCPSLAIMSDANLGAAVGRKHAKYGPWLTRNPCASVARLVPGAHDPHTWTFDPLVVIAVGVWGTVPHSTIAALTSLGLSVAAANAALSAALESIAHGNMLISPLRHSSPTRWRGA